MLTIRSLIAAHQRGDAGSLRALGLALAAAVEEPPALPVDPVELVDAVDTREPVVAGTWLEVRAARDYGDLTPAEYEYLAAAVDSLTQEGME